MKTILLLMLAIQTSVADEPALPSQPKKPFSVTGLLSVDEAKTCGLDKLTKAERAKLDDFLLTKMAEVLDRRMATPDLIESNIDGDFNGWDGDTVFQLVNGQIWQQSAPGIYVGISIMPHVIIYKSNFGGYKTKVDEAEREVSVKRLK